MYVFWTGGIRNFEVPPQINYIITHVCTCCTEHGVCTREIISCTDQNTPANMPHKQLVSTKQLYYLSSLINSEVISPTDMMTQLPFRLECVVLIACPIRSARVVVWGAIPNMYNRYHLRKLFAPSTPGHGPYWKVNLVATMATNLIRGMAGLTSERLDQQVWEREREEGVCLSACPECYTTSCCLGCL